MSDTQDNRTCNCGSGLAPEECCEAPAPGPGRMLALVAVLFVALAALVYFNFINPPAPLPETGSPTHYERVPGFDLSGLTAEQREGFLDVVNREQCPCPCKLTLASCLSAVETQGHECPDSLPLARTRLEEVQGRSAPASPAAPPAPASPAPTP